MSVSSPPLADRERAELADLLDELGPDAPTCCEGWTTAHLAAHLVVREGRPDALPGLGLEAVGLGAPLVAWSHRLEDRLRRSTPYADVVARFRVRRRTSSGPPSCSSAAGQPAGRAAWCCAAATSRGWRSATARAGRRSRARRLLRGDHRRPGGRRRGCLGHGRRPGRPDRLPDGARLHPPTWPHPASA